MAIVAVQNDSLLHEQYWDGYSSNSLSNSFSVAKSVVGLPELLLMKEKLKVLMMPLPFTCPSLPTVIKKLITIRHLLTMSSGLNFEEDYTTPFCHSTQAYYGKDLHSLINSLSVKYTPGTVWKYKSGDTQTLQMVLKRLQGKNWLIIAQRNSGFLLQAGEHTALWSLDKENGNEKAYCCINSNATDFARIGNLVLHEGNWKGKQVISSTFLQAALTPNMVKTEKGDICDFYGYQWWLTTYEGRPVHYARGILGQYIIVVPHRNLVVVRLGTERGIKQGVHFEETYKLINLFTR